MNPNSEETHDALIFKWRFLMNDKKLEFTLSGNQEFMKLIQSEEVRTVEMMERLISVQEELCEIGKAVQSLDETLKHYNCPYNDIAFDALKLSLNQLYTDIMIRIELIYAKDLSVFNRMTFADKFQKKETSQEILTNG